MSFLLIQQCWIHNYGCSLLIKSMSTDSLTAFFHSVFFWCIVVCSRQEVDCHLWPFLCRWKYGVGQSWSYPSSAAQRTEGVWLPVWLHGRHRRCFFQSPQGRTGCILELLQDALYTPGQVKALYVIFKVQFVPKLGMCWYGEVMIILML